MTESYSFSKIEIEDILNNHAYEIAEIIEKTYIDIDNSIREENKDE